VSHQIFNYVPSFFEDVPCFFDLVFCSIIIAKIVDEAILDKSESKRYELDHWLKASKKCSTLLGWLFEGYANEKLKAGGDFELISLYTNES
jgi:hypothetical protein